jgi:hypothetical protein
MWARLATHCRGWRCAPPPDVPPDGGVVPNRRDLWLQLLQLDGAIRAILRTTSCHYCRRRWLYVRACVVAGIIQCLVSDCCNCRGWREGVCMCLFDLFGRQPSKALLC